MSYQICCNHKIIAQAAIKAKFTLNVTFESCKLFLRMITCPLWTASFASVSIFLSHLRLIHASEAGFQMSCGLQGCQRTFNNFYTYRNHVYSMHDLSGLDSTPDNSDITSVNMETTNNITDLDNTNPEIEMFHDTEATYESSGVVSLLQGT